MVGVTRILATLSGVAFFISLGMFAVQTTAETKRPKDSSARPPFAESIRLASNDGVPGVTLHRGAANPTAGN